MENWFQAQQEPPNPSLRKATRLNNVRVSLGQEGLDWDANGSRYTKEAWVAS